MSNRLREARESHGWSQRDLAREMIRAAAANEHKPTRLPSIESLKKNIYGWEAGKHDASPFYRRLCALVFDMSECELFGGSGYENLRQRLDGTLATGTMSNATLDDWEGAIHLYGQAARIRPANLLVHDLAADLADLRQALAGNRSASTKRRLTRAAAHMAGLMCFIHIKLDDRPAFRRWARTARLAAQEAEDPWTYSWVLAQEAYGHLYAHDFLEAINVARASQSLTKTSVGAILAAALEARAQAALGPARTREVAAAPARAQDLFASLSPGEINDSAFGYSEAQLHFHRGNAYTYLGDTRAAWRAQQRALELYSSTDYLDRALVGLDRTMCLARDGDTSGALEYATATLVPLTKDQREGIISLCGREILEVIPYKQKALPAVRQLRELLSPSGRGGVQLT